MRWLSWIWGPKRRLFSTERWMVLDDDVDVCVIYKLRRNTFQFIAKVGLATFNVDRTSGYIYDDLGNAFALEEYASPDEAIKVAMDIASGMRRGVVAYRTV